MNNQAMPNDLQAEQSILGSILLYNNSYFEISDKINSDMFYRDAHKEIYIAITELIRKNISVDIITLSDILRAKGKIDAIGGSYYITQLIDSIVSYKAIKLHANIILEKYLLRKIIITSQEITNTINEGYEATEIIGLFQARINELATINIKNDLMPINSIIAETLDNIENRINNKIKPGLNTGFHALDKKISIRQGELIIIAGRPSMGKTALALNIATNISKQQKNVVIFSLEMGKDLIAERILSAESNINNEVIKGTYISEQDYQGIAKAVGTITNLSISIDDSATISTSEIKAKAIRYKQKKAIDLIVIDYLGLIKTKKSENRREGISETVREIKNLARELNVPIILLCQLNREVENREKKEPRLSDLRESGEIEQTADLVLLIHRDDYYNHNNATNIAKIIIAKHRNGDTGITQLRWEAPITRFMNI